MLEHVRPPAARRPPRAAGTRCCPRTPRPRPRSCCRGGCWCRAAAGTVVVPGRGRAGAARRPDHAWSASTTSPRWPRPRGRSSRSTGPRRARRSRRYAAWSCCSTCGAPSRRRRCAAAGWACATCKATATAPAPRRADRGAARRDRVLGGAARHRGRPGRQPGLAADRRCSTPGRCGPPAERWTGLVRTWLASPRMPGLVGSRDPAGKTWNALAPELAGVHMVETRADDAGRPRRRWPRARCLASGTGPASVVALLRVAAAATPADPRRPGGVDARRGRRARRHRARRAGVVRPRCCWPTSDEAAHKTLAGLLPEPVDHVLLQADLTAVAPGPLESTLARRLQLVAEVESRGGATIYRFTPGLGAARARLRLDRGRAARVPRLGVADAGAAAADLPRRRHRPDLRLGAGRARRGVPARRRRDRAHRAAAPPASAGTARAAPAGADGPGQLDPARRAAAAAARARRLAGGRGRGRVRARGPAGRTPGPDAARAPRPRRRRGRRTGRRWPQW